MESINRKYILGMMRSNLALQSALLQLVSQVPPENREKFVELLQSAVDHSKKVVDELTAEDSK